MYFRMYNTKYKDVFLNVQSIIIFLYFTIYNPEYTICVSNYTSKIQF